MGRQRRRDELLQRFFAAAHTRKLLYWGFSREHCGNCMLCGRKPDISHKLHIVYDQHAPGGSPRHYDFGYCCYPKYVRSELNALNERGGQSEVFVGNYKALCCCSDETPIQHGRKDFLDKITALVAMTEVEPIDVELDRRKGGLCMLCERGPLAYGVCHVRRGNKRYSFGIECAREVRDGLSEVAYSLRTQGQLEYLIPDLISRKINDVLMEWVS